MKYVSKNIRKSFGFLLLLTLVFQSCKMAKMGLFYLSKNHDRPRLKKDQIENNPVAIFQFQKGKKEVEELIANISYKPPKYQNKKEKTYTLDEYLNKKTKTTAFVVIRNDSILYERYFEGFDQTANLTSFSVAKSFTSSLVGFAIHDGYIKNVHDPVTNYIEELKTIEGYWNELTLEHVLNMRSGIDFDEEDYARPNSDIAELYMGKNAMKIISEVKFKCKPGQCDYYSSLDTQILGIIIERATGKSLAQYLEEKIWKPLGMEYPASWSIDSKKHHHTKAFCCLQAAARDYAKFGRLYLQLGQWEGQQLLPEDWVLKSIQPDFENGCYQYQWYSGNKSYLRTKDEDDKWTLQTFPDSLTAANHITKPAYQYVQQYYYDPNQWIIKTCGPDFYALGIFAQEIYVNPSNNMIFIRLGQKWDTQNEYLFKLIERALWKANI